MKLGLEYVLHYQKTTSMRYMPQKNDCAVPRFSNVKIELAECHSAPLKSLMEKYSDLFGLVPGNTNEAHFISTTGNPSLDCIYCICAKEV